MIHRILIYALFLCCAALRNAQADAPEPFQLLRYEENYESFRDPSVRRERVGLLETLKFLPLNPGASSYVTLGGELREKYEIYNDEGWGSFTVPDKRLLHRIMLSSDFHFDGVIRLFLELKSGLVSWNSFPPRPTLDEDELAFGNLFIESTLPLGAHFALTPRFGSQELEYGGERLIAVREGPNVRQSFEGFKLILRSGRAQWDNLWVLPVPTNPGVFEDHPSPHQQLWGSYFMLPLDSAEVGLDLFYLGWRNDEAKFNAGAGAELRHSIGARTFKKPRSGLDWDLEAVYQWGSFGQESIEAFMVAGNTGYTFEGWSLKPRLALKTSLASGDHDGGGANLRTFNPLFPRRNLIDPSFVMAGANMVHLAPYVTLHPSADVTLTGGYNSYWRESAEDGIYSPSISLLRGSAGTTAHFIGAGPWVNVEWLLNRNFHFQAVYARTSAGDYIQQSGPSENVDYGALYAYFIF